MRYKVGVFRGKEMKRNVYLLLLFVLTIVPKAAMAQQNIHVIEREMSQLFMNDLETYSGLGKNLYQTEMPLSESTTFIDAVRPLVEGKILLSEIRNFRNLLGKWAEGKISLGMLPLAKQNILGLAIRVHQASMCLPNELLGKTGRDFDVDQLKFIRELVQQRSSLTSQQSLQILGLNQRLNHLEYVYVEIDREIRPNWSGRIDFMKFRIHAQVAFIKALQAVAVGYQLDEAALKVIVEDFQNRTNGFESLDRELQLKLNFNDSSTGVKTNPYLVVRNRISRLFNLIRLYGQFSTVPMLLIEATGHEKAGSGRIATSSVADHADLPVEAIREIVARIAKR